MNRNIINSLLNRFKARRGCAAIIRRIPCVTGESK